MARFRYKMQNILSIKEKMETQAKQAFADAKRKLDLEQEALDRLFLKKEDVERHAVEVLQGDLDLHEIEDSQMARIIIDQRIEEQKHRVNRATLELETTRALLEEAVKERKTHEKLKEKQFDEFVREENRTESKTIDELTTYTYGQKVTENG
ncbi:MAG: flagellar export protein FliJ [Lachnospiraceae bacterium]|nr:flagellar export protein FliJ [Lachnospiraceae bacterium]MBP5252343.1 flagellar export protein FliJ [Lachnospiraceae bacterium]